MCHIACPRPGLPRGLNTWREVWQVVEETVSDDDVLMIKGCAASKAMTVLLRGANDYMLDEMDRSLHDAFCIVKRVLESGTVVAGAPRTAGAEDMCRWNSCSFGYYLASTWAPPESSYNVTEVSGARRGSGGGAVEAALSIHLENFATSLGSREQLAIAEFADALLVIPKTLAANAAKDATELVAKLRAYHYTAQALPFCRTSAPLVCLEYIS